MDIKIDHDAVLDYTIVKEEPIDDEPEDIKPIDLIYDVKYEPLQVLQNENKALAEKLEEKNQSIAESKSHIEQIEQCQKQSISDINVVKRHWNQFDEDMRVLLQKLDPETTEAVKSEDDTEATSPQLQRLKKAELEEKLAKRVDSSLKSLLNVIEAFDKHIIRSQSISLAVKEEIDKDKVIREVNSELQKETQKYKS